MPSADFLAAAGLGGFQSNETRRLEVGRDIMAAAYQRGNFLLSSGEPSRFYFDKYLFETKPTILRRLASLMAELVPANVDRLVGPALGGVPLAVAIALETGLPFVVLRSAEVGHRGGTHVVGELHPGERVLIVEDVIATGTQAMEAILDLRRMGADVACVLAVLDREQGAHERITELSCPFQTLFRLQELQG